jgi:polyphosphate kinase
MGIIETQLKHVGYELDMLVYTFDKLLLVERLVERSFQAGQVNALIEAFCVHARNLDEFFQGSGRADTLKAQTFADSRYKPRPNDKERKDIMRKINKQISHLTEQRTSVVEEKFGPADRAKLYSILIAEADNFTRHLQPDLRRAWKYVPGAAAAFQIN